MPGDSSAKQGRASDRRATTAPWHGLDPREPNRTGSGQRQELPEPALELFTTRAIGKATKACMSPDHRERFGPTAATQRSKPRQRSVTDAFTWQCDLEPGPSKLGFRPERGMVWILAGVVAWSWCGEGTRSARRRVGWPVAEMRRVRFSDQLSPTARFEFDLEAAANVRIAAAVLVNGTLANELLDECRGKCAKLGMLRDHCDQGTAVAVDHEVTIGLFDLGHAPDLIDNLGDGFNPRPSLEAGDLPAVLPGETLSDGPRDAAHLRRTVAPFDLGQNCIQNCRVGLAEKLIGSGCHRVDDGGFAHARTSAARLDQTVTLERKDVGSYRVIADVEHQGKIVDGTG